MMVPQYSFIHFKSYKAEWDEWGTWVSVTPDRGTAASGSHQAQLRIEQMILTPPAWQIVINAGRIIWLPEI